MSKRCQVSKLNPGKVCGRGCQERPPRPSVRPSLGSQTGMAEGPPSPGALEMAPSQSAPAFPCLPVLPNSPPLPSGPLVLPLPSPIHICPTVGVLLPSLPHRACMRGQPTRRSDHYSPTCPALIWAGPPAMLLVPAGGCLQSHCGGSSRRRCPGAGECSLVPGLDLQLHLPAQLLFSDSPGAPGDCFSKLYHCTFTKTA